MTAPVTYSNAPTNAAPHNGHPHSAAQSRPAAPSLQGPPATRPARPPRRPDLFDKISQIDSTSWIVGIYYVCVVAGALWGGTEAAMNWLRAPLPLAVFFVIVMEVGGVTFAHMADVQQREGDKPLVCWGIATAVAGAAMYVQWQGHMRMGEPLQALVFALLSGLGFVAFVARSSHKRKKQRRANKDLAKPAPSYGIEQWLTEPRVTLTARRLAKDRELNRVDSIKAAKAQIGLRHHIIAVVRDASGNGRAGRRKAKATIAAHPVDLVAEQLGAVVDLDNFVRWIAGTLDPRVTLGGATAKPMPPQPTAEAVAAAVSRAGARRGATPAPAAAAPARRSTAESAALYLQLRAEHGLFDKATGTGWTQEQFAKAMGYSSPTRLGQIKRDANITDEK